MSLYEALNLTVQIKNLIFYLLTLEALGTSVLCED